MRYRRKEGALEAVAFAGDSGILLFTKETLMLDGQGKSVDESLQKAVPLGVEIGSGPEDQLQDATEPVSFLQGPELGLAEAGLGQIPGIAIGRTYGLTQTGHLTSFRYPGKHAGDVPAGQYIEVIGKPPRGGGNLPGSRSRLQQDCGRAQIERLVKAVGQLGEHGGQLVTAYQGGAEVIECLGGLGTAEGVIGSLANDGSQLTGKDGDQQEDYERQHIRGYRRSSYARGGMKNQSQQNTATTETMTPAHLPPRIDPTSMGTKKNSGMLGPRAPLYPPVTQEKGNEDRHQRDAGAYPYPLIVGGALVAPQPPG